MHHDNAVNTATLKNLPEIIEFYNLSNGAADVVRG